ncbi:hypothetical protein C0993_010551 [Termitomyces sp. T159_Od127]|nr:hypothetical protein C0993_010551 [Termitomyces sp. T159_Od127]
MLTSTTDAFCAASSFIARANVLLVQVQGLGTEALCNKVKGIMRLWQKWQTMHGNGITWERNRELLEWCMARYCDNIGAEWLVLFTSDFAPAVPSFDEELEALLAGEEPLVVSTATKSKEAIIAPLVEQDLQHQDQFWQKVAKESEADAQQCITNSLEALALKGLGLGEATGAGKGSWQGQGEGVGAKERTPETTASAARGAATPATPKAPMGGVKRLASPAKKLSPTKPSSKHRGGEAIAISKKSLVLPTCQDEEKEGSKGKHKASLPLLPMEKGKKRARVVSPAVVTPEVELRKEEEDEAHRFATAIEASKAALAGDDLVGPSHQSEVQPKSSQREVKKEGKAEVTCQAHPWGKGLPQWNWLPEWGTRHPAIQDMSSSNEPESWKPRQHIRARYNPWWMSPPAPRVMGEAFEWLGEDLVHPVVPLHQAEFLERMRAWAAHMERVLTKEREAGQAELMGLRLHYSTLA